MTRVQHGIQSQFFYMGVSLGILAKELTAGTKLLTELFFVNHRASVRSLPGRSTLQSTLGTNQRTLKLLHSSPARI